MLTNLLASLVITLVTNVVVTDNAVRGPDYGLLLDAYPGQYATRIITPATERYLTTNVVEHTEITLTLADGKQTFVHERLLSSVTTVLKKLEQWDRVGVRTNELEMTSIALINSIFVAPSPRMILYGSPLLPDAINAR